MQLNSVRDYSKRGDALPIPNLVRVQQAAYERFLQKKEEDQSERDKNMGLEGLLNEVFPIISYDGNMQLEYLYYKLDEPRYTSDECRELRLTYGMPFRVGVRLVRKDVPEIPEEEIYLGEIPVMMGGGEFIINGAERVIVNQLHRSPGVDFSIASAEADRPLHSARIIPERGSWIELEVTKKDVLTMRIDQSTKIPATTFLRALDEKYSTTDSLLKLFYNVETINVTDLKPEHYVAAAVIDTDTGEEILPVCAQVGEAVERILGSALKKISVVSNASDMLILNTIAEEKQAQVDLQVNEHEAALLALYARLRPGNPPQVDKAKQLFEEKFLDDNRYRLGKVGRFRINRKFNLDVDENIMQIRGDDFLEVIKYMLDLRSNRNKAHIDDIDHLGNRRLRTLDELAVEEMRKGFLKLRRTVQERMSVKDPDELSKIADLINSKSISSAIDHFFGRGELSQVVDQTNTLSMLTHERRLSALGPGGLNRKRAGFEVRDVHISHYGRVCPIETPEGTNIGLICSLGIYSRVDQYGFLLTPYRKVEGGKMIEGEKGIEYLRADEEMKITIAPTDSINPDGTLVKGNVLARVDGEVAQVSSKQLDYVDVSPKQIVGVSAALIPFLEHDDANRALMGSNMQRQAVPLIKAQAPCVATGMEMEIPKYSGMVVRAKNAGTVTYVDAKMIVIDNADEYELRKFVGLNERTCQNQKPIVRLGDWVEEDQIIADGAGTDKGELALGKNCLIAFNTFDGYNYEDAIVISERLVKDDVFTSIHIDEFEVEIRETKLGREEFTCDIPNVSEKQLSRLDENGIIRIGSHVKPSDILVGKVSPKSKSELTPEEKLLHAIFGRAGEDVKNDSLEVPAGTDGIVIGAKRFSRRMHLNDDQKKSLKREMRDYEMHMDERAAELFRQMVEKVNETTGTPMVDPSTRQKAAASDITEIILEQIESFNVKWIKGSKDVMEEAIKVHKAFWPRIQSIEKEKQRRLAHMKRGDELPSGVLEMVKIYIATKRPLSVGDKMAGRHGNKGVIARIVPIEDMPFMDDGTPVDVLLNPLGVPSRMNVGQILETHLGWACSVLGFQARTPVFDGATEGEIWEALREANEYCDRRWADTAAAGGAPGDRELLAKMPQEAKIQLHDGRTGEPFDEKTTVGYMYLLKLHHLVDDKIHARATGPYSLITQQPLGGKARTGGQRFGEMEVWALEAYGAAYILQELLTVKSDDVEGRTKIYESMVKGTNRLEAGMPVAFDVLCNEVKGLGLNIGLEKAELEGGSIF
ncbi:DNA-directed RNA polymerase subunit beta [Poriferisphaera corsica]|uniref:DNA-directed RNA polymerase subunit beta n=1 Tax=Poriferisphaera corsica TaxID=2528020 RepID=A0A517YQI9_9BACT|nr:DNA-directed RNA polymerase subunit beta [Poriferisphaera corsica]QDU32492.1 DNA-directed RNA polymerase subunit beta [Poriferisphaera corsica]